MEHYKHIYTTSTQFQPRNIHLRGEEKIHNTEFVELVKRAILRIRASQKGHQRAINYYIDDRVWPELDALLNEHLNDIDAVNRQIWNLPGETLSTKSIDQILDIIRKAEKKTKIHHPDFISLQAPNGRYTLTRATTNIYYLYLHFIEHHPDEYADILDNISETGQAY